MSEIGTAVPFKAAHKSLLHVLIGPVMRRISRPKVWRHLWFLPPLPSALGRRYAAKAGAWPTPELDVPEAAKTVPGVRRDPAAEEDAYKTSPLQDWVALHTDAVTWLYSHGWEVYLPCSPRLVRAVRRVREVGRARPKPVERADDPVALTAALKSKAAELGISAVGVARYDEKYTFSSCVGNELGDRIVVCVLEQNWEATQTVPSNRAEKSALVAYADLIERTTKLAEWIQGEGFRAKSHDVQGENVVLHYAVEAGLGQMGLNGQVLTPNAGSRCRVLTLTTDAPFAFDHPVDYGIPTICDECQICVRRCPSGAIPRSRKYYRGVEKAKLNTARCFPVVAQSNGCAICMKVCPVQRYGLSAVMDEFKATGSILGKGSDELEGYRFGGRFFPVGERPELRAEWFTPPGFPFDPERKTPLEEPKRDFG